MAYLIEKEDAQIFDLINQEWRRQNDHLEMIASENFTFPSVMEAMGSILTNKYAEGYPFKRYYGVATLSIKSKILQLSEQKSFLACNLSMSNLTLVAKQMRLYMQLCSNLMIRFSV